MKESFRDRLIRETQERRKELLATIEPELREVEEILSSLGVSTEEPKEPKLWGGPPKKVEKKKEIPEGLERMPAAKVKRITATTIEVARFQREVYDALLKLSPATTVIIADALLTHAPGDSWRRFSDRVAGVCRELRNADPPLARLTGRAFKPPWHAGKEGGRASNEYEALPLDPDDPPLEQVRDAVVGLSATNPWTELAVRAATGGDALAVRFHLETLVDTGVVGKRESGFVYLPPDGPGAAALRDAELRKTAVTRNGAMEVPGTGKGGGPLPPHPGVRKLTVELRRAGYVVEPTASNHWAVTGPGLGKRILIPGTPSNQRALKNTTARLRREGAKF